MPSSPFDDEFYPGSRTKRRDKPEPPKQELKEWDQRPTIKWIKGKPREFFPITALCLALDRPAVTIRLWIRKGHLPSSRYRLPSTSTNGRETKGRRLYTRAQIEAVIRVAEEHGILINKRVVWKDHPAFALEVADAWEQIQRDEESRGL